MIVIKEKKKEWIVHEEESLKIGNREVQKRLVNRFKDKFIKVVSESERNDVFDSRIKAKNVAYWRNLLVMV